MTVAPADERPRLRDSPGASAAVTFAFADPRTRVFATARLGLTAEGASGLVVLFSGGEVAAVRAEATQAPPAGAGWEDVRAAGLVTTVEEPLGAWTLRGEGEDFALDLRFEARSRPAVLDAEHPAAKLGGLEGYEQLCAVRGTVTTTGTRRDVRCLGQRGHSWGAPDWERLSLSRMLTVWMAEDRALSLVAVRPARARAHADELLDCTLLEGGPPAEPVPVADPRLSTAYDADGHMVRAGLELWVGHDDEMARRGAGEVLCGTSLDLGRLQLQTSFFGWRIDGREGVGRYDVLRRV